VLTRRFGISTRLYHRQRLRRDHLLEIGAHGFEAVEVFANRHHIDYHNVSAVADLQQWLADAQIELHAIHAPVGDGLTDARSGRPLSLASPDPQTRAFAVAETERALHIARRIPAQVLVTHLGLPDRGAATGENSRQAARRSIEELTQAAGLLGVRVAIEVIPNQLSRAGSLVHLLEEELDAAGVGICLDFGHAHLAGDLVEAIETVSGHLLTAHVHDNRGRLDDHLVPFAGTIDWPSALTAVQKVGYDGTLVFEVDAHGSAKASLARSSQARARFEKLLAN
jgi:sugar phosphate isomerase/epimerase